MNGAALKRLRAEAILRDHVHALHEDQSGPDGCEYPGCVDAYWLLASERPLRGTVVEIVDLIGPRP